MRVRSFFAAAALALGTIALTTAPAQAAYDDGVCNSGELCMYYHSTEYGASSFRDFYDEAPNHHLEVFLSSGAGKGQVVGNNASSAKCSGTRYNYAIFFNSNFNGQRHNHTCDGVRRNTPGWLQNNNASSYEPF
ncbi:hypothetical protein [Streptomyces sp. BV286]|uniref:hypothetical protein n=1 Tax=unclassified Streptomyces TaxID=2593676 RepID=UPI001C2E1457|nr:hypothetical protein [Streptomyces sp. BV286]MBV1937455.1 hypothetical protein [Streptomyces sp. BV286]